MKIMNQQSKLSHKVLNKWGRPTFPFRVTNNDTFAEGLNFIERCVGKIISSVETLAPKRMQHREKLTSYEDTTTSIYTVVCNRLLLQFFSVEYYCTICTQVSLKQGREKLSSDISNLTLHGCSFDQLTVQRFYMVLVCYNHFCAIGDIYTEFLHLHFICLAP